MVQFYSAWLVEAWPNIPSLRRIALTEASCPAPASERRETLALVQERNAAQATINWRFNTRDARTKLHRVVQFYSAPVAQHASAIDRTERQVPFIC